MIYLDNAATTKTAPEVVEAMLPYFSEYYGNPSSIYAIAGKSKEAITKGREQIANVLGAKPEEIYFTAGGSESDNWALKATFEAYKNKGNHIITTKIEHHAILHTCEYLEKERGAKITYIGVDENGVVNLDELEAAITPETILISVMTANNEIGTIYPIKEIGAICRQAGVLFHTDAVQAVGHVKINVKEMNIDMLSLSAHKFHGPKGVGAFYCRRGIPLNNLIDGGAQERGKRAGTENVAGIVGLATALRIADSELEQTAPRLTAMRDRLIDGILQSVPMCRLNGSRTNRLPGNCNISFRFIEGESLLLRLDMAGICASSGSACASSSLDPSHVLLAIGLPHEVAHGSVRLSLSDLNTEEDVDYILEKLRTEDELLPINFDNIPNAANVDEHLWEFSKTFDPENKYTIPHYWGTLGILYNTRLVDEKVDSWDILFNSKYSGQIIMENSVRDSFVPALKMPGYSINTDNTDELDEAEKILIEQRPMVQAYLLDSARDEMIAENAAIALVYSGEAPYATEYNDDLAYVVPKEGSNVWVDSWAVTKDCKNTENAEKFLNYLLRVDISKISFEYNHYGTPNKKLAEILPAKYTEDPALFPPSDVLDNCEIFRSLDRGTQDYYSKLWKEIKLD